MDTMATGQRAAVRVPSRLERGFSASENPPAMGRHTHRRATLPARIDRAR